MHGMLPDVRKTVESMAVEATTLTEQKEIGFRADKAMRIEMKIGGGGQTVAAFDYTEAQGAGAGGGHQHPLNDPPKHKELVPVLVLEQERLQELVVATSSPLMTQEGTAQLPSRRPLSRCNSAPWQR
jgi:hypothetical protein